MHNISVQRQVAQGSAAPKMPEIKITVALGAAVLVQSALGLIWAGAASERLAQLERAIIDIDRFTERTARLEERSIFMASTLTRIEQKIEHQTNDKAAR